MAFILYAAGGGSERVTALKRKLGYDQLLSQLNERKALIDWVEYKRKHPECTSKVFSDSGAFSAFTKGKEVDIDEYINLMNELDDQIEIMAELDKIPGAWGRERTPEEVAEAPKISWDNYLYMVNKVKSPEKLLPIFHQGEDFKWLKNMLEYRYTEGPLKGQYIKYIGISCSKDIASSAWAPWFDMCFKMIRESNNPNVKTHAFGMTSLKLLEQYPFTSADSTSWVRSAGFGNIMIGGTTVYTSSRNMNDPGYILNLSQALKDDISKVCNKYGFSFFEIVDECTKEERAELLNEIKTIYDKFNQKVGRKDPPEIKTDNVYIRDIKENIMKDIIIYMKQQEKTPELEQAYNELENNLSPINGSGEIRSLFNLCSLKEWANNYQYRGTDAFKEDLWE